MRPPWKFLSAAVIAASAPWLAAPADAAPLSPSMALQSADAASVETVQWRRGRHGRWIGPAAGFAAGVVVGGALAPRYYDYGYGAYAYDPGYAYGPPVRYRGYGYGAYGCTGEESVDSAYPSWACPSGR